MKYSTEARALLQELEFLFEKYSGESRFTTQPFYLARMQKQTPGYQYDPEDILVRETLLEHIGSLPMVAAAFFPHLNDADVDLGQALVMLTIHDIGELITHDEMTFTKKASAKAPEREAALSLLHESYHAAYEDVETQTSASAKFAKAIDKITPDIYDYLTPPEITLWRFEHFVGLKTVGEIREAFMKKKRPYMLWNSFMTEFHELLLNELIKKLERP